MKRDGSTTDHKQVVKPKARFANQKFSSLTKYLLQHHPQHVRSRLALVPESAAPISVPIPRHPKGSGPIIHRQLWLSVGANQFAITNSKKVQEELWSKVVHAAKAQPSPVLALAVSGMNDVFNTQADTRAAWLNRIPTAAWALMVLIAIFSNFLLGYRDRSSGSLALIVLPVIASIAFFLIADIDSPHVGIISVVPQNLLSILEAMKP